MNKKFRTALDEFLKQIGDPDAMPLEDYKDGLEETIGELQCLLDGAEADLAALKGE